MGLKPIEDEVRVFMAPHEFQEYLGSCDRRVALASRIEARTSARVGKVAEITRGDFFVPDDPGLELAFVRGKPKSLNEFLSVTSPAVVACYGAAIGAHQSVKRVDVERRAMAADPVALSPTAGAVVYSMALLLLFLATMTAFGSVESIHTAAVAFGAVIGSGQFAFDTPAAQEFQASSKP